MVKNGSSSLPGLLRETEVCIAKQKPSLTPPSPPQVQLKPFITHFTSQSCAKEKQRWTCVITTRPQSQMKGNSELILILRSEGQTEEATEAQEGVLGPACTHTHTCMLGSVYTRVCACVFMCVCVHVCVRMHMCVCRCLYK